MSYLTKKNIADIYPLSPMQQGMLFHSLYAPETAAYFEQFCCVVEGTIDLKAFEDAWNHLIRSYPIFRTVFNWKDASQPMQIVLRERPVELDVRNITDMDEASQKKTIDEFIEQDKRDSFDLAKGPLLRFTLFELKKGKYYFIWSYHHILLDGWCLSIILGDLFNAYMMFKDGKPAPSINRPPYKEYISWLQRQDKQKADSFWSDYLSEFAATTPLPRDNKNATGLEIKEIELRLSQETTSRIESFARQNRATLSNVMQCIWGLLLSRYSGNSDVVFGITVSGRPAELKKADQIVGLFINTLPLRLAVDENKTFKEYLESSIGRASTIMDYEYSFLPDIKACSDIHHGESLFDSILVFENYPIDKEGISVGTEMKIHPITPEETTNFDITVVGMPGKEMTVRFLYNTFKFEASTMERMKGHFGRLIDQVISHPGVPLCKLDMLDKQERETIIKQFNMSERPFPKEKPAHVIFEEIAEQYPDKDALVFGSDRMSYRELNERANRIAHCLRANGVGKGTCVAVMVNRSFDMLVSVLGILKAGGAYVPIESEYPADRINYMLADTQSPVAIVHEALVHNLDDYNGYILCLEKFWQDSGSADISNPANVNSFDDLAYIIYTSGSTGTPKGVMVPHVGITRLVINTNYADITPDDRFLQVATIAFDAATMEFWGALLNGGTLFLVSNDDSVNPDRIADLIVRHDITILFLTTVMFNQLVDSKPESLRNLKSMLTGGEMQSLSHMRKAFNNVMPGVLTHVYGPTENTTYSTYFKVTEIPEDMTAIPIGYALANSTVYILDRYLNPVPVGVPGEIYLGGLGLAKGYLGDDVKTAGVFIPNPVRDADEKILYKTGDNGKWLPDGAVDILGRIDQQVKIRGHRIELGEIEATIRKHDLVKDTVVVVRDMGANSKMLLAYYVSENEIPTDVFRNFLKETLPDYMVPNMFMRLDVIPLKKSGKINKEALPEPQGLRPEMATEYIMPQTEEQKAIAAIFSEILGIEKIGIRDNFFDLGGHSLKATQVISRINKKLEIEIPLRAIFETPTVEDLAKIASAGSERPGIEKLQEAPFYPLSSAQKRLWFLDQMVPGSPAYNIPLSFFIEGKLDAANMQKALQHIVDRHETLRTVFISGETGPAQVVRNKLETVLRVDDASGLDDKALLEEAGREAMTPFDLAEGPLFRARIFRCGGEKYLFVLTMHHIISDGWSVEIFVRELIAGYAAYSAGGVPSLPELRIQYRDYSSWQNNMIRDGLMNDQEEYWKNKLGGVLPVSDLPADRPRPLVATTNGAFYALTLDMETARRLKKTVKEHDVTLYMYFLAILDIYLSRVTGQEDIVVGSAIAGRNNQDIEALIGFFVNSLALRTDISGNPEFADVLSRAKQTCIEAYANQDFPFDRLIDKLKVARDTSRTPVFTIMLVMQDFSGLINFSSDGHIRFKPVEGLVTQSKFDLTMYVVDTGENLELRFEYNTDLFDASTMQRYAGHIVNLVKEALANPKIRVSEFKLLTEDERKDVLTVFNETSYEYPSGTDIVGLFEKTVIEYPNHPAVVFEDNVLTYSELNRRSNKLCHALKKSGVDKGALVGLMAGTPVETILGIIGILKAGGAYMPIDSEFPENRISFMLEDSASPVVITRKALVAKLPLGQKTISLDEDWDEIDKYSGENPGIEITADDTAYAIYTSGSTGKPKGTLIPHRGVINLVHGLKKILYSYYEGPLNVAQVASFSFDASVQQIFASLLLGNTLFPVPASMKRDIGQLIAYIIEKKIDVIDGTPSLWELLVANGLMDEQGLRLKHVIIGGEALPTSLVRSYLKGRYGKKTRWTNVYGVTESSVDSTYYLVEDANLPDRINVPIGAPIINTRIYVLDKRMNPMPIGVPGEIYIGGDGLAKGYLNNPERTSLNFVSDPFMPGETIYRTGDLGKWLPDGNIDFLGRIDFQVKIRGFRIELGEIETALSGVEGIMDCVVIDRNDGSGGKYLAAYYVSEKDIPVSDLRSYLANSLPDYMVPARFMRLEALPLNTSGKVDRSALPEPETYRPDIAAEFVAPRNDVEMALAEVWMEVLRIGRVGVFDNFFDLGGDSIISLQVVSKLKNKGYEIKPRHMFEHQCIAELAHVAQPVRTLNIEQGPVTGSAPLTPIQMWFDELGLANPNHFNQSVVFRSDMALDEAAIKKGLQALLDHHDAFRTRFDGGRQLFIEPGDDVVCRVDEISDEKELKDKINLLQSCLDIKKGPVFAAGLYGMGRCSYLAIVAHHLVIDGVSWRILLEDLFTAYGTAVSGGKVTLPAKSTSYKQWALELEKYAGSGKLSTESDTWRELLSGIIPAIPVDFDKGPNTVGSSASLNDFLDVQTTSCLMKNVHSAYNTEVPDILVTALARAYNKWSGSANMVIDMEGHGRESIIDDVDISRTVGWFTSIYPVLLNLPNASLGEQLKYVKETLRKMPEKGANYCVLKYSAGKDLPINNGLSLNYLGQAGNAMSGKGLSMIALDESFNIAEENRRANLIDIVCLAADEGLRITIQYSKNHFSDETIIKLGQDFRKEIGNLVSHCLDPANFDITPSDFELLSMDQTELDSIYE